MSIFRSFKNRFGIADGKPSLETLTRLTRAFSVLPYENVTKLIRTADKSGGDGHLRMPQEVLADFLDRSTGGTCFSLTRALYEMLIHSGFTARPVMADMKHGENIHCALVVSVSGRDYLVDPGYLISRPLPLPGRGEIFRPGPAGRIRLAGEGNGENYHLWTIGAEGAKHRYRLKTRPVGMDEFREHWIRSFDMPMMNSITITGRRGGEHIYVRNDYLRRSSGGGKITDRIRSDYHKRIEHLFGIPSELVLKAAKVLEDKRVEGSNPHNAG